MIVKTLVENTAISDAFQSEHGLSLYVETEKHKLLFDVGAGDLFIENAKKMGIDLAAVDLVVISHGHCDHGGGLKNFLNVNTKAKIYLHQKAFERHYSDRPSGKVDIGLDEKLLPNERFIFVDQHVVIDEELTLFSHVPALHAKPSGNQNLFMLDDGAFVVDDFTHEQNLIITENEKTLLIAGCAHNGIMNIMEQVQRLQHDFPDYVIGGFHLYNRSKNQCENPKIVKEIGEYLKKTNSKYYTCHCTGVEVYQSLKEIMKEKIEYLATGSQLNL